MKKQLIFFLMFSALTATAQKKHSPVSARFIGTWGAELKPTTLRIHHDTTEFTVVGNQLWLLCKNAYYHDTLLLYVLKLDRGREFNGPPWYNPPKISSLFAKCYIRNDELRIIYVQKSFRDNEKGMGLVRTVYKD